MSELGEPGIMVSPKGVLTCWLRGGMKGVVAICTKAEKQGRMAWFTQEQKNLRESETGCQPAGK